MIYTIIRETDTETLRYPATDKAVLCQESDPPISMEHGSASTCNTGKMHNRLVPRKDVMVSSTSNNQHTTSSGLWIEENTTSLAQCSPTKDTIPAGFSHEYRVLTEICAHMSSGFLLLNQHARLTYVNASALRLLHIDDHISSDLQSFDVRKHLLAQAIDAQKVRAELDQLWQYPDQEYTADLALADAAAYWLRMRSFPVCNRHGHFLGRGMLLDDITLERSIAEARAETLAMAAHELRTPLAIIKGCATTLLSGSARWEPLIQREMLQMIDAQSDHLYDVLNTLLDVWRFDAGTQPLHLAHIQIAELLLQTVKRWQNHTQEYQFILDLPPNIPTVVCDALRIEQVLNHLLNNAIAYASQQKIIRLQLEANENEARISISDEGIGIASEHLERIFERFYRVQPIEEATHQTSSHSGLGLAAARATIEAHNGKIWAESAGPGQGSTFCFTLPFATHGSRSVAPSSLMANALSVPQGSTRASALKQDRQAGIFVAENDTRFARYIRAHLEEYQYKVYVMTNGLQLLRQIDLEEPDMLIISTQLADISGIELLQRVRDFSQVPVMMLCTDCHEDERVQLFDFGCDDLLVKPFGIKEMLSRVRALLRRQTGPTERSVKSSVFKTGELQIDYAQHLVTVQEKPVQLSRTEYKLLSVLAQNAGMVMTHELLLERVWGPEYNRDVDFIWVYISRLRRKIEADSRSPKYILTVPDVGYKLTKQEH